MSPKHESKVQLIPWDHASEEQVTRLYEQRVACGWRSDEIPLYIESAKRGGRVFYWIALADDLPDRDALLESHTTRFPKEAIPITDTAREIRLCPREPSNKTFIPVGHLALEVHSPEENAKIGLPAKGVVWIHQLYVSYALQKGGFGARAMDIAEKLATEEPFNGNLMVLDTMQEELQMSEMGQKHIYVNQGIPPPKISTVSWYTRRGYKVFPVETEAYQWNYGSGIMPLHLTHMKKVLE
ncbi:hypothetical protein E8E14_015056 [Neopestalotiopsis sp. 37M]|nr:hypothetical protein E8E14_015056 [Neopestalotiopsis sp. 37M]